MQRPLYLDFEKAMTKDIGKHPIVLLPLGIDRVVQGLLEEHCDGVDPVGRECLVNATRLELLSYEVLLVDECL